MKKSPVYKKVEQWEIYDRLAGSEAYPGGERKFLPSVRYDWALLTEIELFRSAVKGCEKVLDVGCGTGHPSLYIAKDVGSIIGVDKSEKMIEIAKTRLRRSEADNVTFEVGDAQALRFADSSFDAIILCGSLATFSNKRKALQEIQRVLKKNGKVVGIEANWLSQSTQKRCSCKEGSFALTEEGLIKYRYARRSFFPHKETDYRCIINQNSVLARKLMRNHRFREHETLRTRMSIKQVESYCAKIEYDEEEKFDAETIASFFAENGFKDVLVSGYGVMYDLLDSAGLVNEEAPHMKQLCKAEATISHLLNPLKTEMLFLTCKA